jgi:uncharacterized repeat protein (TIGR01451 family)
MKNILLLLTLFFGLQIANAQYVTIPDANFRAALKALYPTCFNASNMMDTTCNDIVNAGSLNVENKNIVSIQGIQYFKNIGSLNCQVNKIDSLPVLPNAIVSLLFSGNKLKVLPTLPSGLINLFCNNNLITELTSLPSNLVNLRCENNQIINLPILPNSLIDLYVTNNKLKSLPELPATLNNLYCANNQLTTLPVLPQNLRHIWCNNNHLVLLPNLPKILIDFYFHNNQLSTLPTLPSSLTTVYGYNNLLTCLPLLPYNLQNLLIKGNHITCLPNAINPSAFVDTIVSICTNSSNICETNPITKGKIYNDINNNNIYNSGEQFISQQIVKVLPNNWLGASDVNGNYFVKLDTAINNIWNVVNNYRYATVTPTSYTKNPKDTLGLLSGSYDFGIYFIPNVKDLETTLGSSPARPGFTTNISLTTNNVGTVNQSNITIKLNKPNGFNILSTSIAPTSTINDTLFWKNISINYLENRSINIELQVPVNAVLGDTAVYEAWSNGTLGDSTPIDNYVRWTETIRGSFDPNDKLVNKATLPPTYNANKDRLLYTIRFQNTGTDTAFTVIVRDEIPNNLDVSSLRVVNASHAYQLIVREKNIVEIAFPNIQLPATIQNEAKSHGFVQLEFKPKAGLPLNAEINNNASIFFDYNAPVITNTITTRVQITTGIANNKKLAFKLFPNPASEKITIQLPYEGKGKWLLTDISGKIIKQSNIENNTISFDINVNDVTNGSYLLTLEINGIVSTSKVAILK